MKIFLCYCFHHTVIPSWIYRIPSELRSQARMGLPSTVVGDNTGIVGAVCFLFFVQFIEFSHENIFVLLFSSYGHTFLDIPDPI